MSRNTPTELQEIFDTDLSSSSLQAHLDAASALVDDLNISDSSRAKLVEKYLAAHIASTQDQRVASTSRETASVNYQGETGNGLSSTIYGQQAITLDPTGSLVQKTKPSASIGVPDSRGIDD